MPTYGIVFSGGGALGAWEVGCYDAIKGRHGGSNPVIVSGASAGALNAVGVCAGMSTPELTRLWQGIKREDVCDLRLRARDLPAVGAAAVRDGVVPALLQYLGKYDSLYTTDKFAVTLSTILSPHFDAFMNSSIYLAISVTNLVNNVKEHFYKLPIGSGALPGRAAEDKESRWSRISSLDHLIDALLGSTALPILFPPRAQYFDGGVLLNQPISPALRLNEPEILYVVIPSTESLGKVDNILNIGNTLLTVWLSLSLVAQLKIIQVVNDMRRYRNEREITICVIRPPVNLGTKFPGVNLLSFGEKVPEIVDDGRATTYQRLNRFRVDDPETWY